LIKDVTNHFGRIDVLVNNAGVIQVGPLADQMQQDFEDALAVHFWGPFYTMQAVVPQMKKQGAGRIVNIASIGGKISVPHLAPYCASKFALVGLSGAMRVELAKDNIVVTTVCPGLMRTGSHFNAIFKGQNKLEFALLSTADALPFTSVSAEKAARQIIAATKRGDAETIISVPAQLAAKANSLLPELVAEVSALVNQILPAAGGIETGHATGKESASIFSPSFLTTSIDKAARRNNELKPGEQIA
ncbi:MAG: SDR family NAD(P)-dependent oxidoreductase, partial [Pyrinomonadaceae bacterium]